MMLSQYQLERVYIPLIKQELEEFVQQAEKLYGSQVIRINIHQLLHMTQDIQSWGLLWTHNSFVYESMNGFLNKLIHGTKAIPAAAIHALSCLQQLKFKEMDVEFQSKESEKLYEKLQGNSVK